MSQDTELLESAEKLVELRVPAEAARLKLLRSTVRGVAELTGLDCDLANDIVLAVNEACANIIQHAYHEKSGDEIRLSIYLDSGKDALIFLLEDDAPCVDVGRVVPRDLDDLRPGGLGVHFIQKIMDEMTFLKCEEKGNTLLLIKHLRN